jgi:hypothetical protein
MEKTSPGQTRMEIFECGQNAHRRVVKTTTAPSDIRSLMFNAEKSFDPHARSGLILRGDFE